MEGLAIVVPSGGRYCNFSKSGCCHSAICRCCCQSLPCLRVASAHSGHRRLPKLGHSESAEEDRLLSSSTVLRLRGGRGISSKSKERWRRLVRHIVLSCAYGETFEALKERQYTVSEQAGNPRGSPGRRSGVAQPIREDSGGSKKFLDKDGGHGGGDTCRDDGGPLSFSDRRRGSNESIWGQAWRQGEITGNIRARKLNPLDESGGVSDSWAIQDYSTDREGVVFQGNSSLWDNGVGQLREYPGISGRAKDFISRQPSLNIPRSELLKIEELRLSGEMKEGDSGAEVLNLQRALFWLGHLPGLSLTGYFGPETTRAVQEFHNLNGFSNLGVWGIHSQQLLWKHIYPKTRRRHVETEAPEKCQEHKKKSPYNMLEKWRVVKNASEKVIDDGLRASQASRHQHSKSFREFAASVSSTLVHPISVSQRLGVIFLTVAVLSIMIKLVDFRFSRVHGQPVRKRVMHWRNGVDLRKSQKASKPSFNHKSIEGWNILQCVQNHLGRKSVQKQDRITRSVLDRLVLFDGELVREDYLTNGRFLHGTRSPLLGHGNENSEDDRLDFSVEGRSLPILPSKQFYQSGSKREGNRTPHGLGQFHKVEADPPRKRPSPKWSPVQIEKSPRCTGGDLLSGGSGLDPRWESLAQFFVAPFFPHAERLPYSRRKEAAYRAVAQNNSSRWTNPPHQGVPGDSESNGRSSNYYKGVVPESRPQHSQEENELELKKRVGELHNTVQSIEETRQAAMRALAEEKMHNLELEVKVRRQKETAATLEEEVRVLKDSHEALIASLKKKYSSSAAARAAAALLYQNYDPKDSSSARV